MASLKEVMGYALDLDTSGFSRGLDEAKDDAKRTFDDIEEEGEQSSGRFEGVGGKMGTALVAGFAAIGVGALLLQGIESAFERQDGLKVVTGQFDLTAQEAEKYGKLAGDLYSEGWGDGITEVQQVVAQVAERLAITTDKELSAISSQVLAVSKTWGEDFDAVIRSTDQLIQNDLAPNAQAALDLIVGAFQNGGNEAGDLLDTIDEYSQHWSAMGLSGEDALNQIIVGFQGGQRDADKLADAVKEMRIRVVDDSKTTAGAYQDLGLDAEKLRLKFLEGGPAAREAFLEVIGALQSVEDPYEQNRLAVALIGTQFEDLGPKALEALGSVDGALDDTTGKAAALAEMLKSNEWTQFKREGENALAFLGGKIVGEAAPAMKGLNDIIGNGQPIWEGWGGDGEKSADQVSAALASTTAAMETINAEIEKATADVVPVFADDTTKSMGLVEDSIKDGKRAFEAASDRAKRFGDDGVENMDRVETAADETETSINSITAAFEGLRGELSDRSAYLDLQTALDGVKTKADEAWTASKEGAEDAEQKTRDAEQATIDLKNDVIDYAEQVGNIPKKKVSSILAQIDKGKLAEAEAALAHLERVRNARIRVTVEGVGGATDAGAPAGVRHAGGVVQAGQAIQPLSGEAFVANTPGRVLSRERVDRLTEQPTQRLPTVININVTGELIDERTVRKLTAEMERLMEGQR